VYLTLNATRESEMFSATSMLSKKQLIGWRRTDGSRLIVSIDERSTADSSSMRKELKNGAGSRGRRRDENHNPYGLTVELLREVLPISQDLSTTAIRRRVRQMAQRLEDELGEEQDIFIDGCQRDWDQLPDPPHRSSLESTAVIFMQKIASREAKDGSR
jgi:hypothetical protein